MKFEKEKFLEDVERVLHADYACDLKSAGRRELYNAVSKAVMERRLRTGTGRGSPSAAAAAIFRRSS